MVLRLPLKPHCVSGTTPGVMWVDSLLRPTLPSVHCRSPSCRFCQQLSAAPLPSFPTSPTSVHGYIFVAVCKASLYIAVVDLVLLVCNTLWWAWSLLLIRICSSWSLGSIQSWFFLSGLPRYVLAVLYTTCCRAAHSSYGVEFSFSSHWARALSISCSKLSLWLMVLSFAVLSLVGLFVPYLLCFCRILKATFDLRIW